MSLALLVVGCVLPIALVSAFLISNFYGHERTQLTTNAISRARAMASVVDRDFANIQAALLALSTSPFLASDDLSGFHAQAVRALGNMQAESIVLLDPTGRLLLSTSRNVEAPLEKLVNPPELTRFLEAGKAGVSDLFVGPLSGHLILLISLPVKRNGVTAYTLNASLAPVQLMSVLTEQRLPDSWRAVIIDSTGYAAARSHGMKKFFGKKVSPALLQRMSVSGEDAFESTTLEGIPVVTVYSRSPLTRWTVALGLPLDELTAGLRRTLAWLIVVTFASLVIGLALAWLIGGRIARSITALTRTTRALGSGEQLTIPNLQFREANELRQALLDAATNLQQAKYESHHDALTGLANRALFHIVVNQQLALCQRNRTELAVLYIDLDGFKAVNDTHGHATGDQLLRAVSIRIKGALRDSDIAARLGGDEFAVALVHIDLKNANAFAERLIEIISAPYQLGTIGAAISASIGVAGYPVSATDIDTLLKNADHAMYKAKGMGKRRACKAEVDPVNQGQRIHT
jgi:diguanylate cyclase (GGDEF)-like protein